MSSFFVGVIGFPVWQGLAELRPHPATSDSHVYPSVVIQVGSGWGRGGTGLRAFPHCGCRPQGLVGCRSVPCRDFASWPSGFCCMSHLADTPVSLGHSRTLESRGSGMGLSGTPGGAPRLGDPRACVSPRLDYNHPFMLLGRVGTQSQLQALVTCGLAPSHSPVSAAWEPSRGGWLLPPRLTPQLMPWGALMPP